ncbi:MAG: hypothetical protein A2776_01515 [Candidatus Levybacteria bacterium RIFCSPHIGHO2_01_FULL_40_10]|nr:MAG: hypothetical protein A2776_01515 [Candidatus Levybacteria bacterium RIFCSPHIGHO2_01_FULL_40_10]
MKIKEIINQVNTAIQKQLGLLSGQDRNKIISYLYIVLTLFAVSFFGFFAIAPTLSTISTLNKQYLDSRLVYESLRTKLSSLQSLDVQHKQMEPELNIIYSAIPKTTKIPQLTRQIENIAAESNVQITRLSFGTIEIYPNVKTTDPVYSYTFSVAVSGSDPDVNSFLSNIISFDRIIGVDRVATGLDEKNKFTAAITGRAYFLNN